MLDDATHTYRGTRGRCTVRITPGLEGSSPVGIQAELDVEARHGEDASAPVLLRPSDVGATAIEKELVMLFREAAHEDSLLSIALAPSLIRLRFRALTSPDIVERTVASTIETIESLKRARAVTPPYR